MEDYPEMPLPPRCERPRDLSRIILARILELNQDLAEAWDVAWQGPDDPALTNVLYDRLNTGANMLTFKPGVVHAGPLVGGDAFELSGTTPFCIDGPDDPRLEIEEMLKTRSESLDSPIQYVRMKTWRQHGRIESWAVCICPDSPPYAINDADALQAGAYDALSYDAPRLVRQAFGPEAVVVLSVEETERLAGALATTPAQLYLDS